MIPVHLAEADYNKIFPAGLDEFPTPVNEQHYIDAWLLNTGFNSILAIEQFLLSHAASIDAPVGTDVIGVDGSPLIDIPSAYYGAYKQAMAWDSNLLAENIRSGITIFGVTGTY